MAKRLSKLPEERRIEILEAAQRLFETEGYEATSVDHIVRSIGVAKGTFYYYFKSKEEILDVLAKEMVMEMADTAESIAEDSSLSVIEKICTIIHAQSRVVTERKGVVTGFHRPENKALHERCNVAFILALSPILARVIDLGNDEKIFDVADSLSTIQFILAGSEFLFGEGIFNWTIEEKKVRIEAMIMLIERALGAEKGIFMETLGEILR